MEEILLKKNEFLVRHIPDYYAPKKKEGFSTHIQENDDHMVGVIEQIGRDFRHDNVLGKIIYFEKDICKYVNVKGKGKFHIVPEAYMILIRMDQDKDNY